MQRLELVANPPGPWANHHSSLVCTRPHSSARPVRHLAFRPRAAFTAGPDPSDPGTVPGDPYVSFPVKQTYLWDKEAKTYFNAPVKGIDNREELHVTPGWLSLIEGVHWLSFVFGTMVLFVLFNHAGGAGGIAQNMGLKIFKNMPQHSTLHVFCLLIAHTTQTYGAFFGILMHEYEGWQIAEFRNPLVTNDKPQDFNNAWLRAVVYRLLFAVQSAGLLCFAYGALQPWSTLLPQRWEPVRYIAQALAAAAMFVAFVGPRRPPKAKTFNGKPVLPLPIALEYAFVGLSIVSVAAHWVVFNSIAQAWQLSIADWLYQSIWHVAATAAGVSMVVARLIKVAPLTAGLASVGVLLACIKATCNGVHPLTCLAFCLSVVAINIPAWFVVVGSLVEGLGAESGFDQFYHFATFFFMHANPAAYTLMYLGLVQSPHTAYVATVFVVYFAAYAVVAAAELCRRAAKQFA